MYKEIYKMFQTNCLCQKHSYNLPFHMVNEKWHIFSKSSKVTNNMCINPFRNKPWFLRVCNTTLLKTMWEKKKLLATSNFSFSHSVFYPFGELSAIFIKFEIVVCKLFQFGRF